MLPIARRAGAEVDVKIGRARRRRIRASWRMQFCRSALVLLVFAVALVSLRAADQPCIFCEIAAGRVPAAVVLCREGEVLALMDHTPRNPGHVLVIPTQHAENLLEVPPATLARMADLAQRVAQAIRRTDLRADGLQLQMNTGKAAGQTVFHAHLHVIPRFPEEPAPTKERERLIAPAAELEKVAAKIRAQLVSR